ncbi:MAG: type II secretion system F family protein [bacterium]|nr:type II secretion system F family protein [bacterium]
MLFNYEAKTEQGDIRKGTIEAPTQDLAVSALQRNNLIIVSVASAEERGTFSEKFSAFFERVKLRDIVIVSRQLATLFEAKVPVVDSFKILVSEAPSNVLRKNLRDVLDDIQGGLPLSQAMGRHPKVFSDFYVNMVRAGEESGELEKVFTFLADYLDRSYQLTNRVRNALIYPAFVLSAFLAVMILMMTIIIPRLSSIIIDSGQPIPLYTQIVITVSNFFVNYGIFLLVLFVLCLLALWRYIQTKAGKELISSLQLQVPYIGELYRKLYMARFSDNLQTLVAGGVSIVRALEITGDVVGNQVYRNIIYDAREAVRAGASISEALFVYPEVPRLVSQMIKVGEETGKLDFILATLSKFYRQEVNNAVDNLINLIEPILILVLGLGVGLLVASVIVPIYNISSSI